MKPKFVSLTPTVLDEQRVTLALETTDFPPQSNIHLALDSAPDGPLEMDTARPAPYESPFPHVDLSILNENQQEVAHTFIVEHQEPYVALTLYIRHPQQGKIYTAQASMTFQGECLDTLKTVFTLTPPLTEMIQK